MLGNEIETVPGRVAVTPDEHLIGCGDRGNGQDGVYVTGVVTGTQVQDNAISGNAGDGVTLVKARKVTIGGNTSGAGSQIAHQGNRIVTNQGYGLYALGVCTGSVVQGNMIVANAQGNVNLTNSRGITYIPK